MRFTILSRVAVGVLIALALAGCEWRQKHTTHLESTVGQVVATQGETAAG